MRSFGLLLLTFMCFVFQESLSAITLHKNNKTYIVGTSNLILPPLLKIDNGKAYGYSGDILNAFATQKGVNFEFIILPQAQLQLALDKGNIDFIFPDNPQWTNFRDPDNRNIFSKAIIESIACSFVMKSNSDLKVKEVDKVSVPFGYTPYLWTPLVTDHSIKVIPSKDLIINLKKLSTGEVDASDLEYNIGVYLVQKYSDLNDIVVSHHLPHAPVPYHMSTKHHVELLEELSIFVTRNSDLIDQLKTKYKVKNYNEVFNH